VTFVESVPTKGPAYFVQLLSFHTLQVVRLYDDRINISKTKCIRAKKEVLADKKKDSPIPPFLAFKVFKQPTNCCLLSGSAQSRCARWFIFKPKIPIWVNFGGPWNVKCQYIL
jgi:hypothetical protein